MFDICHWPTLPVQCPAMSAITQDRVPYAAAARAGWSSGVRRSATVGALLLGMNGCFIPRYSSDSIAERTASGGAANGGATSSGATNGEATSGGEATGEDLGGDGSPEGSGRPSTYEGGSPGESPGGQEVFPSSGGRRTAGLGGEGNASLEGTAAPSGGVAGSTHCELDAQRCVEQRHQRCKPQGWVDEPCPPYARTCENDRCVIRGPSMVTVEWGTKYWIDTTEVTRTQYKTFFDAKGYLAITPSEACQWNQDFTPDPPELLSSSQLPITGVDYCDAEAFCLWAGKRLCGKIGGGPAYPYLFCFDQSSGAEKCQKDQWYRACAGSTSGALAYSGIFTPGTCNVSPPEGAAEPWPVGSNKNCQRTEVGALDLSGNVDEWQDACFRPEDSDGNPASDHCLAKGGAFSDHWDSPGGTNYMRCDGGILFARNERISKLGFRCCAE